MQEVSNDVCVLNHPFLLPRITSPAPAAIATTPSGRKIILRLSPLALKSLSRSVSAVRPNANAMTPAIISTIPTMTVGFMMLNSPTVLPGFRLGWRFQSRLRASPSKACLITLLTNILTDLLQGFPTSQPSFAEGTISRQAGGERHRRVS